MFLVKIGYSCNFFSRPLTQNLFIYSKSVRKIDLEKHHLLSVTKMMLFSVINILLINKAYNFEIATNGPLRTFLIN